VTAPEPDGARGADRRAELQAALAAVEARLVAACRAAGRRREELTLVAVTKTRPASDVALLAALGVRDVGESKDQEAAAKVVAVADELTRLDEAAARDGLRWHFVGRLQRNKARSVASYASVVHSVDRLRLVPALSEGAVRAGRLVQVLLQVSLDGDPDRGGVLPADLGALADAVEASDGLALRGVMAVAPLGRPPEAAFAELAAVSAALRADHPQATAVSAGMSADLEAAVAAGSTHVRVGTALLGQRPPPSL
jgi:PLP dependent protein